MCWIKIILIIIFAAYHTICFAYEPYADQIKIDDQGNYYNSSDTEGALQEIGSGTALDNRYINVTGGSIAGDLDINGRLYLGTLNGLLLRESSDGQWLWLRDSQDANNRSLRVYNLYATNLIELAQNAKLIPGYTDTDKYFQYLSQDDVLRWTFDANCKYQLYISSPTNNQNMFEIITGATPQVKFSVDEDGDIIGNSIAFKGNSPFIDIKDKKTLSYRDAPNNLLMSLQDQGTTGKLTVTGDVMLNSASGKTGIGVSQANSKLHVGGPITTATTTKTANYTITDTDSVLFVDSQSTEITITLPQASTTTIGRVYYIYKVDNSSNLVTLAAQSGNTINAVSSVNTQTQFSCIRVIGYTANSWIANIL